DLVELLDHLQVVRTHVMGLSLGGMIAQRFAIDHPDRVSRLVLTSCANHFGPYLRAVATLVGQSLRRFPPKLFARTMQVLGGGPLYFDANPQRIEQEIEQAGRTAVPRAAVLRQLRCLAASEPDPDEYHISAPTLVIAGEHDSLIPHCYARRMARVIPDSRFMLVPEAGHNPFNECPDQVLPAIIEFLHASETAKAEPQEHDQESGPHRDAA
ncbi:MAG: alpha/beta hydrolase, partial [Phycisphaeraceae bacterium]